ncbi:MAG: hypothetical protein LOY58_05575 [Gammaproteobacteria bacterium]|nr:hypothetical protein [Gammaproteobacteria bacterium]
MRMVTRLAVAGILLALGGCASLERFQRDMDGYVGWHIDQLRERFGYNYIERDIGDGMRAYTWVWAEHSLRPGYRAPDVIHTYRTETGTRSVIYPGDYFPPDYYEYYCEFSFIVNPQGRAVSWRAHGNGCAAYPGPENVVRHGVPVQMPSREVPPADAPK